MIRLNIVFGVFLVLFLQISFSSFADTLTFRGVYQGKNLIAQNPYNPSTKDYCTKEIFVNNLKAQINTTQAAFEIDLSSLQLSQEVEIKIVRASDCDFKIINSNVIDEKSSFSIPGIAVNENTITWSRKGEQLKGRYHLERLEYGNWTSLKELSANGNTGPGYSANVTHLSGLNTYRVRYIDFEKTYYSEEITYASNIAPVVFKVDNANKKVSLSRVADFRINDFGGNEIKKGKGAEVDYSDLNSGTYFLECDNKTVKIKIPYTK